MSAMEVLVVIVGLLLGYWIIGALIGLGKTAPNVEPSASDQRHKEKPAGEKESDHTDEVWWHILEVSQDSSKEEIVTAYKNKIRQYHPDKVAQMGLEIRQVAEQKSKQINAAYEAAMKLRM